MSDERKEFSDETKKRAWKRSGGKCEKCKTELVEDCHDREEKGCWEAHHKDGNPKNDKLENCQILCWPCHEKTLKEGKPVKIMMKKNLKIRLGIRKN